MTDFDKAFDIMRNRLQDRKDQVRRIAEFKNGFESWLKFELAVALREQPNMAVWRYDENGVRQYGDVGVEYRYRRAPTPGELAEGQMKEKLIDLWYGHSPTLYFELKTAFGHVNTGKQIQSWLSDYEKLDGLLRDEVEVAGYASVLLAIGFGDEAWANALALAKSRAGSEGELRDGGLIAGETGPGDDEVGPIRLCAIWRALAPSPPAP